MRDDRSAVELHEFLDQGQADAHATVGAIERAAGLHKQIEDAVQHIAGNPFAGIAHTHHDFLAFPTHGQPDPASGGGVLHRVVEQIHLNLLQTREVAVDDQRCRLDVDRELLIAVLDLRAHDLQGRLDSLPQIARLEAHVDLSLHYSRDVQQVVQQTCHEMCLAFDHAARLLAVAAGLAVPFEHVGGIQHSAQRVPQFMRQNREKLVAPFYGFTALDFGALAIGNVLGDAGDRDGRWFSSVSKDSVSRMGCRSPDLVRRTVSTLRTDSEFRQRLRSSSARRRSLSGNSSSI